MRNLFPTISDMRCVIRFRFFQSLKAMGIVPNPQDQFGKSESHDKSLDTGKKKLEEFMKGPWPAFQTLVRPSIDHVHLSRSLGYRDNRSEMSLFESKYFDFHRFYSFFLDFEI